MLEPLFEHQILALRKLSNGKILRGGVGSGKTRVAVEYYKKKEAPRDVYVITTAKKRDDFDWQEEFYKHGIGPRTGPTDVHRDLAHVQSSSDQPSTSEGTGGSGFGEAGQYPWVFTVDSWNNIAKYANVMGAFFIFDEQRLVGSGEWTRKFLRIAKHNHWILLTATPGDTWMDYIPVFVANNFYKNRSEFKREHVVYNTFSKFPKVERYINQGRLVRQRNELLVEMPDQRHTRRHMVEVDLEYDKDKLDEVLKKRWNVYEERPLRDIAELFSVARRVVNSDPSRLNMVCDLWKNHPKLIVFYNFNYELELLRSLVDWSPLVNSSQEVNGLDPISKSNASLKNGGFENTPKFGGITDLDTISSGQNNRTSKALLLTDAMSVGRIGRSSDECSTSRSPTSSETDTRSKVGLSPGNTGSAKILSRRSGMASQSPKESSTNQATPSLWLPRGQTTSSPPSCAIAEWNGHRHQPIPTTDRWLYLVQYTAGAEGWNCIETDAMIMYSRNYSWKVTEQAYGRNDRINTLFRDLWYYIFTTNSWIDRAIERSLKAKETFNESKYKSLMSV